MSAVSSAENVSIPEAFGAIELAGDCNIRDVTEIAATFQQRTGDLLIDARGLTGIDVAILQLLVSACKSSADSGCSMRVAAPAGGALHDAVQRAGLEPMFRDVLVAELP